jgi:Uma2 family endonuclease
MSAPPEPRISPEEYLSAERESETKHEYVNGEVYAIAGASRAHNLIANNIGGELRARLRRKPCEVYPSDMRLQVVETGFYTYPDVMVVCDQPRFADAEVDTLLNPKVIVDVLSDSTEAGDRTRKRAHYRQLASLAEYLMVVQDRPHVEQYVRQASGAWLFREYRSLDDVVRFPSLGCRVPLSEIYLRVEFPAMA